MEQSTDAQPVYFTTPAELRKWLERNHEAAAELWIGFFKTSVNRQGIRYAEALDQALCFGWIDGVRKAVDESRYMIRFSPRKRGSTWSAVNARRAQELIASGLITPAGLRAFQNLDPSRTRQYSYEQAKKEVDPLVRAALESNLKAKRFFESQAPSYQRTLSWWVVSAKKDETRQKRLAVLLDCSARGERLSLLNPKQKRNS